MNFLVIGAGAMGCLFAARLKRSGFEVSIYEKIPKRVQRIQEEGIRVEGANAIDKTPVPVLSRKPFPVPDTVIFCVKSYDTEAASKKIAPWLKRDTMILTLQNGLGNIEILEEVFGKKRVLGGVTSEGATVIDHGRIRHAGAGETSIGPTGGG
ncbi:MAG: ketopantoate reductase family protein, partial [Deltaproteobacteria bacterium]|nr:ketopantoate reductase family protein [Deltaproteobacteria bacterium]